MLASLAVALILLVAALMPCLVAQLVHILPALFVLFAQPLPGACDAFASLSATAADPPVRRRVQNRVWVDTQLPLCLVEVLVQGVRRGVEDGAQLAGVAVAAL